MDFTVVTPAVFMYVDSACEEALTCEKFGAKYEDWIALQSGTVGSVFFIVDLDEIPELRNTIGIDQTPWFTNNYNGIFEYSGPVADHDWFSFMQNIRTVNKKPAKVDAEIAETFDGTIKRNAK